MAAILTAAAILAGLSTPASAVPRKSRQMDATVVSVDLEHHQLTVSSSDGQSRSFELRPDTIVLRGATRASVSELKQGVRVRLEYRAPHFGAAWVKRIWILG